MAEQDNEKRLDQLLDSLLASYSDAQPRPGLETRILANLRGHEQRQPRKWGMIWLWAGAVAAVVLMAVLFVTRFSQQVPAPTVSHVQAPVPPVQKMPVPALQPKYAATSHQRRTAPPAQSIAAVPDIRRQVFPTPVPLSEQERLLLGYLAGTAQQEIIAQSHPERPLPDESPEGGLSPEIQPVFQRSNSTR